MGAKMIHKALKNMSKLTLQSQAQEGVMYAAKIDKSEARIDWRGAAKVIDRQIRGLSLLPGAWTVHNGKRLKLLSSEVIESNTNLYDAGQILNGRMEIACSDGAIRIKCLQKEGGSAQSVMEFMRGSRLKTGERFE